MRQNYTKLEIILYFLKMWALFLSEFHRSFRELLTHADLTTSLIKSEDHDNRATTVPLFQINELDVVFVFFAIFD